MILGAILAGGRSERFGSDKALALLDGKPLMAHVADALAGHVESVVVFGRDIPDRPRAGLGPLGGINAALDHAARHGFDAVLTAPCDSPRLDAALLSTLAGAQSATYLTRLPVLGLWPVVLQPSLDDFLARSDDRSVRAWARSVGATPLDLQPPANVNAVADLAALQSSGC